ncbi:MAG: hypothetical protein AB7I38_04000 [Dehalococcoidia bacterium]
MLEIHPADLLPFERSKSLATAAHASILLHEFTELRRLYPDDVERGEARLIHDRLCWLLEASLREPSWADEGITWEPIPFEPPVVTPWLLGIVGLAAVQSAEARGIDVNVTDLLTGIPLELTQLKPHIAPTLRDVMTRVSEILLFQMIIPHPPDEPEYGDLRRALFLFGKYWESYRAILDQYGSVQFGFQPHPMSRFIASLQHRLRECAERIDDVTLSEGLERVLAIEFSSEFQDVWGDGSQPQINYLQRVFEDARIRHGSRAYDLTKAEDDFLKLTAAELVCLGRRVNEGRESVLNSVETAAPAVPVADLTAEEEEQDRRWSYHCRIAIDLTHGREKLRNIVSVGNLEVSLTDADYKALMLLVLGAVVCEGGWVPRKALRTGAGLSVEGRYFPSGIDQALKRLRDKFAPALGGALGTEFIEARGDGRVRLSVHPAYLQWDRDALVAHRVAEIQAIGGVLTQPGNDRPAED